MSDILQPIIANNSDAASGSTVGLQVCLYMHMCIIFEEKVSHDWNAISNHRMSWLRLLAAECYSWLYKEGKGGH